jgi:hypothetical protein
MDERELDSLFQRPFGRQDAMRADAQVRRCTMLAHGLFGKTFEDLQRQLLAPYPEIPPGYDLSDFRELQRVLQMTVRLSNRRSSLSSPALFIGNQPSKLWEARHEVVRRAIEYLESH